MQREHERIRQRHRLITGGFERASRLVDATEVAQRERERAANRVRCRLELESSGERVDRRLCVAGRLRDQTEVEVGGRAAWIDRQGGVQALGRLVGAIEIDLYFRESHQGRDKARVDRDRPSEARGARVELVARAVQMAEVVGPSQLGGRQAFRLEVERLGRVDQLVGVVEGGELAVGRGAAVGRRGRASRARDDATPDDLSVAASPRH